MTNSWISVLCCFRQVVVALTCDMKGMFHHFFVNEEYRDLFRFFWLDQGDLKNETAEYHMKVHVFGAASSPGCANSGFKRAANDGEKEFGSIAADLMQRGFYVDDGLNLVKDASTAVNLIQKTEDRSARAALR